MTLGWDIYQLVHDTINTTVYSSAAGPNVDNKAKIIFQDPGLVAAIDDALNKVKTPSAPTPGGEAATGGGGDFENALAELINDDFNGYADDSMSDQEYAKFNESSSKQTPLLGKPNEAQAVGLVKSGINTAFDPASLGMAAISKIPHAALVLLAISLAPMIVDQLKSPGSMLDVRWKRIMAEEYNALMSRQDQWNAQIGLRQVYVQSHDGFLMANGAAQTESNLRRVRENVQRIADRLEFTDHAKEFFN